MTRAPFLLLALGCLALALGCNRGTVMQPDRIRFSHGPHLRAGNRCLDCHDGVIAPAGAGAGTRAAALPSEARCRSCHTRPEQQRCGFCHTEPRAPGTWAPRHRELVFRHDTHVARARGGCVGCHGAGASDDEAAGFEPGIPAMATCTDSCHAADMRQMACSKCHTSLRRYTVEQLAVVRHGEGFARRHGTAARASGGLCGQCHEPTFCVRCHSAAPGPPLADLEPLANTRDFVHRGDFMARHADEARLQQGTCTRCHGVDFCDGCHQASGVGGRVGPGAAHPPGWLDPLSPRGHARAARRNILACASCHESDATQVCVPCHREGGGAGNPHPPGFAAGFDRRSHGVCVACHPVAP